MLGAKHPGRRKSGREDWSTDQPDELVGEGRCQELQGQGGREPGCAGRQERRRILFHIKGQDVEELSKDMNSFKT